MTEMLPQYGGPPIPQVESRTNSGARKKGKKLTQLQKLKRYQHDVELARRVMEPLHKDWRRHIEFYKGNQWLTKTGSDVTPRDGVVINQVASIINTITPAITTQPPKLRATPMRPQDEEKASLVEALLNYEWERLNVSAELQHAVKDMLITGNGFLKTGHEYLAEEVERDPDEVELDIQQAIALQNAMLAGEMPTGMGAAGLPPEEEQALGQGMAEDEAALGAPLGEEGVPPEPLPPEEDAALQEQALAEVEEEAATEQEVTAQVEGEGFAQPEPPPMSPEGVGPPMVLTEEELRALIPTVETVVIQDDLFVERISPFDVYVDPEARNLDEARWIAQRIVRPLEDVQADPNLKNTRRLKPTEESKVERKHGAISPLPTDAIGDYDKRVVLWEYYNLKDRTLCIFAEGHDAFLFEGPYTYPFDDSPFSMMRDYIIPDELWAYGEVTMIEGPQVELNKIRTQQLVHNKRFNRKHLYRREAFDPEGIAAIQSDEDGIMVPVAHGQNLVEAMQPIPDSATSMPTDRYQMSQVVESDLTTLSGVSDYQRGAFLPRHVTASEANLMSNAQDLRARDKLDRVETVAAEVGSKLKALAQTFFDTERWMLITGNGKSIPVAFDKTDIEGEFDIRVEASSTQAPNEVFKQQQAERIYQLLRPDPLVKGDELIRQVLEAFGIKVPDRFIMSPEEQMMEQLQAQMGMQPGMDPSITGTQPGQAEGNIEGGTDFAAAVAGGQEAAVTT